VIAVAAEAGGPGLRELSYATRFGCPGSPVLGPGNRGAGHSRAAISGLIVNRVMPSGLKRYQQGGGLHFLTFSCYHRLSLLGTAAARRLFENALETVRERYRLAVPGYVAMPERVHLLVDEPALGTLATAIQALKLSVAVRSRERPFRQARYYDYNVPSAEKTTEKLRHIHRNPGSPARELCALGWKPVARGLVAKPEDWAWSSFRHYATGERGTVEIESFWTARKRGNETLVRVRKRAR
jgi:putative transposase